MGKKSSSAEEKEKLKLVVAVVLSMPLLLQMFADIIGDFSLITLGILITSATMLQLTISSFYYALFNDIKSLKISTEGLIAISTSALWLASVLLWIENGSSAGVAYAGVNGLAVPLALYGRSIANQIVSPIPAGRDDEFMMPRDARTKQANGTFEKIPLSHVRQGDLIQIMPGEISPVDGAILEGSALFTAMELNADPMPRYRAKGDNILAGETCFGSTLVVQAIRGGYESRLTDACSYARMAPRYEKTSRLIDKFLMPLTITLTVVSAMVGLAWSGLESPIYGLTIGLATLGLGVSAAFGLVSSLPQQLGAEYLKSRGVLIHQPDIVETARNIDHLFVSPVDMFVMNNPKMGNIVCDEDEEEKLSIIYGMLKAIDHPLLKPVQIACDFRALKPAIVRKVYFDASRGITGEYDDKTFIFGNPALLSSNGVGYHKFSNQVKEMESKGESVFWLAESSPNKECLAVTSFHPTVRANASEAIEKIKNEDISVDLLSLFAASPHMYPLRNTGFSSTVPGTNSIQFYNSVVQTQTADEKVAVMALSPLDLPAAQPSDMTIMSTTGPSMLLSYAAITLSNPDPERMASAVIVTKAMGDKVAKNVKFSLLFTALALGMGALNILTPTVAGLVSIVSVSTILANSFLIKSVK